MKEILIAGLLLAILALIIIFERMPTKLCQYPEPHAVALFNNAKCLVYETWYRSAPIYAVICDDGSTHITRDYLYLSKEF